MAKNPLVELRHVYKRFSAPEKGEITVLDDISFTLFEGEIVAILGRSGCGKSTLLRIICGLTRASDGEVRYRGEVVDGPVPGISMVFQTFGLFPWLTVQQNVELGLEAQGVSAQERRQRALAVIDMIGLDGFESAYPKELSGGMRQRVGFARALVVNPDVLLMDEAFSALDVPTSETLRDDLLDLWIERLIPTRAILMVSHSIEEVLMIADRVVILESNPGRVKSVLRVPLRHPRDSTSAAFRHLVDEIYAIMTAGVTGPRPTEIGHRLPDVQVSQLAGALDAIHAPGTDTVDLSALSDELQMEVDDLFPIIEALQLLDLARVSDGDISLTRHGRAFLEADIRQRKEIFGEHLLRRVPLAGHIRRVIDDRPNHVAPESRFLRELEDHLSEQEAERVLATIIDWGRYAELFEYDYNAGSFRLPDDERVEE